MIGLAVLVSAAAAALAAGPLADPSAPSERAFAAQHGSEVTATAKASPAQLAASAAAAADASTARPITTAGTLRRVTPPDTARSTGAALIAAPL